MGLKIAIVSDTFYPYTIGGAEKRYWELAKRLTREHEVHMFTMQWPGMSKNMVIEGVKVHAVCRPTTQLYRLNNKRSFVNTVLFAIKLLQHFFREGFDVIDCNNSPFLHYFAVKLACLHRKVSVVTTFHEVWGDYWDDYFGNVFLGFIGRTIETITLRTCDKVIVLSQKTQAQCVNIGVRKERVTIIPDGVDVEKIQSAKPLGETSDVIYAGRLINHKHIDVLVNSVARAKLKVPKIKCFIIGLGPEKMKLKSQVQQLQLEDNVNFFSPLPEQELYSRMKSSKVFVLSSTREGFGLVVLEANACGLPVITVQNNMNDACDFVENGKNGFVVPLSDEAISSKIVELLLNNDELSSMSRLASEHAIGYSWETTVNQLIALYKQLNDNNKQVNEGTFDAENFA